MNPRGDIAKQCGGGKGVLGPLLARSRHRRGVTPYRKNSILTNMADGNNAVFVGIDPRAIRWLRRAWGVPPYRKNSILTNMADDKNVVSVGSDAPADR